MNRQIVVALAIAMALSPIANAQANKACALASPAEIEGVLGAKVSDLKGDALSGHTGQGDVELQMCSGNTAKGTVVMRIGKRTGNSAGSHSADAARKGIEQMKKMGAQVDVKINGPITCSTIVPPKNLEQYGFNTTCSVTKPPQVAAIEIQTKTRADMAPIEKLRPLAEKMSGRF